MISTSNKSIIICGIVRDAEVGLRKNIPILKEILEKFKDYRVFIYENDSVDSTKQLLLDWQTNASDKIHISINNTDCCKSIPTTKMPTGVNPFFSHKRIDKMAKLRNYYLDYVSEKGWIADYMMVVDLDVAKLNVKSIMSSFADGVPKWDAVTAFGYSTSPEFFKRRYHDSYALTLWEDRNIPQTEEMIVKNSRNLGSLKPSDDWIRVASAFGGVAIYRFESISGLRYSVPAMDNDDSYVEARCEHYSLYKQMIDNGNDKIYINPAMLIKYQSLSLMKFLRSFHQSTFLNYYLRKIGIKR